MDKQKQQPTFDSQLFGMTTIIECGINNIVKSQGSGFFFNPFGVNSPPFRA